MQVDDVGSMEGNLIMPAVRPFRSLSTGVVAVVMLLLSAGCFVLDRIDGSGRSATEQRDVAQFTELQVRGALTVEARSGDQRSVTITGDDNILRIIKTNVRDNRLTIEPEKSYTSDVPLRVSVVAPDLRGIVASGASTVTVEGIRTTELSVQAGGASTVRASGSVERVTADATGASRILLGDVTARDAGVRASGASMIEVSASGTISGRASGASSIRYRGTPQDVQVSTSGASSVRRE
jgi:hypothetical protein